MMGGESGVRRGPRLVVGGRGRAWRGRAEKMLELCKGRRILQEKADFARKMCRLAAGVPSSARARGARIFWL